MKEKILGTMKTCQFCVVSTVASSGQPQSALVGFSENEELELTFGTSKKSRKYKNLLKEPRVAVVFGKKDQLLTIQYEGTAKVLKGDDLHKRLNLHFQKLPFFKNYLDPDQVWFKIHPSWIRYSDSSSHPATIQELRFDS